MPIPTDNFRSPAALSRFFLVCAIGLGLDLFTKSYAFDHLAPVNPVPGDARPHHHEFIPGWVTFETTINRGAVFGVGQGQRPLFLGVSIIAIAFLSYLFATSGRQRFYQVILGMLLAGVLGNMYDRIVYEYVRDMIHALPGWHWPGTWHIGGYPADSRDVFPFIFNVADVLLCVGVGLMIVYSLFAAAPERNEKKRAEPDSAAA